MTPVPPSRESNLSGFWGFLLLANIIIWGNLITYAIRTEARKSRAEARCIASGYTIAYHDGKELVCMRRLR